MFPIQDFMTKDPQRVAIDVTVAQAHKVLRAAHARHLPVVDGARLVGIVSLTSLYFAETHGDGNKLTVKDAMEAPVKVPPDAAIERVAELMARMKSSAAVVMDGTRIVGIFTTVDALRVLAWLATSEAERGEYHHVAPTSIPPGPMSQG